MANSFSAKQSLCHTDESSALLQFKQTFSINKYASSDPSAYPKVASWKLKRERSNCCSWDGVECDQDTGHVIGLELSNSFLHGLLKLEKLGLRGLLQNLNDLEVLRLSGMSISFEVPDTLANLTSFTTLVLENCGLRGEFSISIFYLPKLQILNVHFNKNLTGHLPKFHPISPLQYLTLSETSFSRKLPDSIGNLHFLNVLDFSDCYFSESLPTSLGNLTQLNYTSLSSNQFNVGTLPLLGKLTELTELHLSDNNLYGSIPSFLSNLTQLILLNLSSNHLSGEITSQLMNLTHLISLDLDDNQLEGSIPG
ncbi:hypothetical protein ACSBR2_011905 [Camellia fascicularis]